MEEILKQILDGQAEIKQSIADLKAETKQSFVDLEQGMGVKVSALFDSRELQINANERICGALNRIENNLERLTLRVNFNDVQLRQIK
jgi:hypothetical protein